MLVSFFFCRKTHLRLPEVEYFQIVQFFIFQETEYLPYPYISKETSS